MKLLNPILFYEKRANVQLDYLFSSNIGIFQAIEFLIV